MTLLIDKVKTQYVQNAPYNSEYWKMQNVHILHFYFVGQNVWDAINAWVQC